MWGKWKQRALSAEETTEHNAVEIARLNSEIGSRWQQIESEREGKRRMARMAQEARDKLKASEDEVDRLTDEVAELKTELQTGEWMLKLLEAQNGSASTIASAVGEAVANSVRAAFPVVAPGEQPVVDLAAVQDAQYNEGDGTDWTDSVFPDGVTADRQTAAVIQPGESIIPGLARPDMSGEEMGL